GHSCRSFVQIGSHPGPYQVSAPLRRKRPATGSVGHTPGSHTRLPAGRTTTGDTRRLSRVYEGDQYDLYSSIAWRAGDGTSVTVRRSSAGQERCPDRD